MKRALLFLALVGIAALAGCIPFSVSPFYEDQYVTFDTTLLGEWTDGDSAQGGEFYLFEQASSTSYTVSHLADERTSQFDVHLFRIEGQLFIDMYPIDAGVDLDAMYADHMVPTHSLFRIEAMSPALLISTLDYGWLKEHLDTDSGVPAHMKIDDRYVFTAPSDQITAWLGKIANIDEAFVDPELLTRVTEK